LNSRLQARRACEKARSPSFVRSLGTVHTVGHVSRSKASSCYHAWWQQASCDSVLTIGRIPACDDNVNEAEHWAQLKRYTTADKQPVQLDQRCSDMSLGRNQVPAECGVIQLACNRLVALQTV
jgi:hypothetical protein